MHKDTQKLIGKTIKYISKQAINCWRIDFSDGTKTFIWAETDGPFDVGQIWLLDEE